jgi:hypothetical protein
MMKCDFPTTCSACRLSDRKKLRDDLNDVQDSIFEAINPEEATLVQIDEIAREEKK